MLRRCSLFDPTRTVQWKSLVVGKRMEIKLAEYYAVASSGLIFSFEKNFHKEYIAVFVCIRLEFSNTLFVSACMSFHSESRIELARYCLFPFLPSRFLRDMRILDPTILRAEYRVSCFTRRIARATFYSRTRLFNLSRPKFQCWDYYGLYKSTFNFLKIILI